MNQQKVKVYIQNRKLNTNKQSNNQIVDKKGVHKVPVDYQGARTAGGMAQASLQHLASFVEKVTTKNVENFLEGEELAKVLLFTSKKTTTDLYKALSVDFHNRLKLGEVHESEKSVGKQNRKRKKENF